MDSVVSMRAGEALRIADNRVARNQQPTRVLLIEDNPADGRLIQELFAVTGDQGFRVEWATKLADGLGRLARGLPEVILLDLSLPDCRGIETFRRVHREAPDVPIIVLSGLADEALAVQTLQEGAQDYLVKGQADGRVLVRALRYAIQRARMLGKLAWLASFPERNPNPIVEVELATGTVRYLNTSARRLFPDLEGRGLRHPWLAGLESISADWSGEADWEERREVMVDDACYEQSVHWVAGIWRLRVYGLDITKRKRVQEQSQALNAELARGRRELLTALADLQRLHGEQKAMQAQLIRAAKMESVGRLAAGVAHEVKNPLAIIQMGVACLAEQSIPADQETQAVLREMRDAIGRADAIVCGLLDFSSPSCLEQQPEDLNAVLRNAVLLVRHQLEQHHVHVRTELAAALSPVTMDRRKVEQVFVNLLLNAAQAMPDGGDLVLHTSRRADAAGVRGGCGDVRVEIEDTGPGIPPDKLTRVFEPFFTTKPGRGSGLGLAVAKTIVESHGGRITLANRPQGGLCATVEFAG